METIGIFQKNIICFWALQIGRAQKQEGLMRIRSLDNISGGP